MTLQRSPFSGSTKAEPDDILPNMFKMAAQFILSGCIVVFASYISPKLGQKWAGLVVAAPLLTLLTFIFLSLDPTNGNLRGYLASALIFMLPAAAFIGCLLLLSNRLHFVLNILLSAFVFGLGVLCIYKLKLV